MNLQTPTTQEISDNIIAQLQTELNVFIPLAPKAFMRVLAKVLAGVFILLYKYGGFTSLQMFVSTATLDETEINGVMVSPLTEWGRLVGASDPIAATQAELNILVNVVTQGGTLSAGTQFLGAINGVTYVLVAPVALNAAVVFGSVRAVSDQAGGQGAGVIGNLDPGEIISFANPLSEVQRDTTVFGVPTVTGVDAETAAAYRQRVLDRFQKRPQGGAYADYEIWGEGVAGIAAVYPYTSSNPGQVDVYVEAADLPDGIPNSTLLDAVADAIELDDAGLATRRPAGALVTTFAITRTAFDIEVTGLVVDNQAQVESDITDGVTSYFLAREPFIVGLSPLPRKDRITDSGVTSIVEDIVNAAGGVFTDVIIDLAAVPQTLYTLGEGEKAKASTVTFI